MALKIIKEEGRGVWRCGGWGLPNRRKLDIVLGPLSPNGVLLEGKSGKREILMTAAPSNFEQPQIS